MNLLFGIATTIQTTEERFQCALKRIEELCGATVESPQNVSAGICCGHMADDGSVLGWASKDDVTLRYVGSFSKPLPDWTEGSPSDEPNFTAAYLLSRYCCKGPRFLDGLPGQYVVAVVDKLNSRVLLGSDPYGFRRAFCSLTPETFIFSSNLIAAAFALGEDLAVDRSLEDFLLGYGFLPWNRTLYKGIDFLAPGTLLEWSGGKAATHTIEKSHPWQDQFSTVDFQNADDSSVVDILYDAFMEAIEAQCPSHDDVAVILGGFDSALVASGLKRLGKKVETFTFHFDDPVYNQPHTDTLARYLGINHNWVPITNEALQRRLLSYSSSFYYPASLAHYPAETAYACGVIRQKGFRHALSGDGCDQFFLGYPPVYRRARFFMALNHVPSNILKSLLWLSKPRMFERWLGHPYRLTRNALTILGRKMPARGHLGSRAFDDLSLSRLRCEPGPEQEKGVEEILEMLASDLEGLNPVRLAYHGKGASGLTKNKMQGASDYSGVSINSPYMYPGLIDLAGQLPDTLLRTSKEDASSATGKYILMKMAERKGLLPREVIYQKKKSPVLAPVDQWYMGELRPFVYECLSALPFDYDKGYVEDLLKYKLAEEFYRRFVAMDHLASQCIGMLISYASFTKLARKRV